MLNSRAKGLLIAGLVVGLTLGGAISGNVSAANADEITVTYPYYGFVEDPEKPWVSVYDALDETGELTFPDSYELVLELPPLVFDDE